MALPSSGYISLSMIQAEFGAAPGVPLSSFYRGGAYVPNIAENAGVPTSGVIYLTDFYGATKFSFGLWSYNSAGGTGVNSINVAIDQPAGSFTAFIARNTGSAPSLPPGFTAVVAPDVGTLIAYRKNISSSNSFTLTLPDGFTGELRASAICLSRANLAQVGTPVETGTSGASITIPGQSGGGTIRIILCSNRRNLEAAGVTTSRSQWSRYTSSGGAGNISTEAGLSASSTDKTATWSIGSGSGTRIGVNIRCSEA